MNPFISIDPGHAKSNGTGWAFFSNGELLQAGLADSDEPDFVLRCKEIVAQIPYPQVPRVVERMRVYPGPQQKGDQNDLLDLSILVGIIIANTPIVELYPARSWKGQVDKKIMQARIEKRLTSAEQARLPKMRSKDKYGSLLEGIGLGLWIAKRLG